MFEASPPNHHLSFAQKSHMLCTLRIHACSDLGYSKQCLIQIPLASCCPLRLGTNQTCLEGNRIMET